MKARYSKTVSQQCRYYEVENIFEYMVSVYLNGNISTFTTLFKELEKEARKDFIDYLFYEVNPHGKSSVSCPLKPSDSAPLC